MIRDGEQGTGDTTRPYADVLVPPAQGAAADSGVTRPHGLVLPPLGASVDSLRDAAPAQSPRPASGTPGRLGPFVIERELARGGMGVVYVARHEALGRLVALKVMKAGAWADAEDAERFRFEAQAAARLRHPNIVGVHEVGQADGTWYLAMDLVEGPGSLQALIEREGPLEPARAARLMEQIARAMHYAHSRAVLHRDLKPHNVLVAADGSPHLTDFGLAKDIGRADRGVTVTGQVLGTPAYMSPEQALGDPALVDRRSDVYGLGATLYACLVGQAPFRGHGVMDILRRVVEEEPPRPTSLRPGLDGALETIVLTCLYKDPARRYASAEALADDLDRWARGEPIAARRPTLGERLRSWRRRRPQQATFVAVTLGVVITATLVGWGALVHVRARERAGELAQLGADVERARERLGQAPGDDAERTSLLLELLEAAQRWHAGAPGLPEAARAHFDAAMALGEHGRRTAQWSLGEHGFGRAGRLGVDDVLAGRRLAELRNARTAEAGRRREEVARWLAAARSGDLARRPEGLQDAVFAIVRHADADAAAVELLAQALEDVARELLDAEATWVRARLPADPAVEEALAVRSATPPGADLPAHVRAVLERARTRPPSDGSAVRPLSGDPALVAAQLDRVGQGTLDLARVACEALGRLGRPDRAVVALGAYLHAEADPGRAVPAGLALRRLPGPEARALLRWSQPFHGHNGPYRAVAHAAVDLQDDDAGTPAIDPTAWSRRGIARLTAGDHEAAIDDFTRALELAPELFQAWTNRGVSRSELGDHQGAIADHTRAIELAPELASAWSNRGNAREATGDLAGAIADQTRAIELLPDQPYGWVNRAMARAAQGDFAGALADHTRAIELDPGRAASWMMRGTTRLAGGDPAGASADHSRALELDPRMVDAWVGRARARHASGDLDGAVADATRALELEPRSTRAVEVRALAREARGDLPGALDDYTRAIELAPREPRVWLNRAKARGMQHDYAGMRADCTRALELDPALAEAWFTRGLACTRLGELQAAIADLIRAVELDPRHAAAWKNLGIERANSGDLPGGLADLSRALELAPDAAETWALRGRLRAALHDRAGARADLARSLELAGDAPWAPGARALLDELGGE